MPLEPDTRACLTCETMLRGRIDKKFCDDYCRNSYNNQLKASKNNLVRNINNALGKNRRILESFFKHGEDTAKTTKEKLLEKYLSKGTEVAIEGKLMNNNYTDKDGNKRFFTEIHVNELLLIGPKPTA